MSDYIKKEIGNESPEPLEQMVAEALMRDSNLAPDADAEWQKLSARMSKHSTPLREQEPSDRQIFMSRRWWTVLAAASVAAIVVVMLFVNNYFSPVISSEYGKCSTHLQKSLHSSNLWFLRDSYILASTS